MVRFLVIPLSVLLTGCGLFAEQADSPDFADSTSIQRALGTAGLTCHSYQSVPEEQRESGMEGAVDVGHCEIDGERPLLVVWKDNDQRDDWVNSSRRIGCAMADGFGASTLHYVSGERWSVSDTSQKLADKIADAIGGEAVHAGCEEGQDPQ
jgi:hypothetical protein